MNKIDIEKSFKKKVKRFEDTLEIKPFVVNGFKRVRRNRAKLKKTI